MDNVIIIEIMCSKAWTANPLATHKWAEVPSPRFASPEAAMTWIARRAVTRPLRVVRIRLGWGISAAPIFAVEALQF